MNSENTIATTKTAISGRAPHRFSLAIAYLLLVPVSLWALAALYYSLLTLSVRIGLCIAYVTLLAIVAVRRKSHGSLLTASLVLAFAVGIWWWNVAPSNDGRWQQDVARLPQVEFLDNDVVEITGIRDFIYESEFDYTPRYTHTRQKLSDLKTLDLFLIYWGSPWIAHTIMSFGFADGTHIAVSIETRKQVGQTYSAVRGFFRQFTLMYVVATERDVIGLRTNLRKEDVYLYRLQVTPEFAQRVFVRYAEHISRLNDEPEWYNALTDNCTTSIRNDIYDFMPNKALDWRMFANGHIDEMLYERGGLLQKLPFAELKRRAYINARAQALPEQENFSKGIRVAIPGI